MNSTNTTIVLGGPGCGKTEKLLTIVEEALTSGIESSKIGFMSFTKKAAEEGKNRASEKFGIPPEDLPYFRTIHSLAFRQLGIRRDQMVGWPHVSELGKMLGLEFKGRQSYNDDESIVYGMGQADRIMFLEGLSRNTKKPLETVWSETFEDIDWWELELFARTLKSYKKSRGLYDFNDLLEKFLSSDFTTLPQFDLLIIDEAQDNSPLQWDIVRMLGEASKQIYVGGDDCQCLYRWSGSDVSQFTDLPGKQITLNQSYRVPLSVHKLADTISDKILKKRERSWKPRSEVGSVNWFNGADEIDLSKGTWSILARNGYMLNELEDMCMSQGFSFHSVNRDPLKSPSLAAISTWENLRKGNDEAAQKILDVLQLMDQRALDRSLVKQLKTEDPSVMHGMPELTSLGLHTTEIWHKALTRISPDERDFFIAARQRGESLLKKPRLTISTIHGIKGAESDHTLLLTDVSYRCFQNAQDNMDDELRVFYVAVTRCRESLNLVMPRTNLSFEI